LLVAEAVAEAVAVVEMMALAERPLVESTLAVAVVAVLDLL